jgi:uncharacterized protein YyaL (SSP411 family)
VKFDRGVNLVVHLFRGYQFSPQLYNPMHTSTNRLSKETSPYLLQHAHNPVDWYPWGEEALEKARKEDKPILVSIGYSACHWCHVMERESFENEDTAAIMNDHFVNIKIDREERPDIDHIYMDAVQAMTGSGGWPLNVFLLPDGRPFYGGTYFPPIRAHSRISWRETLSAVSQAYKERKHELESQAENLTEHLRTANAFGLQCSQSSETATARQRLDEIAHNMLKQADKYWGGFGKAPKFPQTFTIVYLLRYYHVTKNKAALDQALLSLDKMIYGGIYDQLGGGFARYSTDEKWLAPHFEKMLYDNALLISALSEAYQLTKNELYAGAIRQTMDFMKRELWDGEGGFYSALDADSEGVEGKFYTWSKQEIDKILMEDSELFCTFYDITEEGNWEHTNILWVSQPLHEFVEELNPGEKDIEARMEWYRQFLEKCRQKLLKERSKRIRPGLDDKILLSWNALMNTACSKAYAALGEFSFKETAILNMQFMEAKFKNVASGEWFHTYKNGDAKYPAFLEDYAYLVQAYIHLQEITGDQEYLLKAKDLTLFLQENFAEDASGYFFFTHKKQTDVIVRKKELYDGAIPSGNAVMASNLHYLSVVFDRADWFELVKKMIGGLEDAVTTYPTSFGVWASEFLQLVVGSNEIAVVGDKALANLPTILKHYIPNRILQTSLNANDRFPLLTGKEKLNELGIYLCKDYACQAPVSSVSEMLNKLEAS